MLSKKNNLIALVGMDGSGKSANLNMMKTDPDFADTAFLWVRWEPRLLKPAYFLLNKKQKTKSISLNESYNKKAGTKSKVFKNPLIRNVWLRLAILDYTLQFRGKTKKTLKSGNNVVFDRYYLDLFIDQGINFDSTPHQIENMIRKYAYLYPKMLDTIYIRVHPEVCFTRKNDIPNIDYLNRRWNIYEHLSKAFSWTVVDGEQPFEEVYAQIKKIVRVL